MTHGGHPASPPPARSPSARRRPIGTVLVTGAASGLGRAVAARCRRRRPCRCWWTGSTRGGRRPALADAPTAVVDLADTRAAEAARHRAGAGQAGWTRW